MDFKEPNLYTERYATSEFGESERARRQSDGLGQIKPIPAPSNQTKLDSVRVCSVRSFVCGRWKNKLNFLVLLFAQLDVCLKRLQEGLCGGLS